VEKSLPTGCGEMNDLMNVPSGGLFAQLYNKLEAIEKKQDEQTKAIHDARIAMVRMEERQITEHDRLTSGAGRIDDHDNRIESLEKSRDKVNTILGMIAAAWSTLLAFGAWLWSNFPPKWKP
jgi:hypothetical protein